MDNTEKRKEYLRVRINQLESEVAQLENGQTAIKILLNSLYGALG